MCSRVIHTQRRGAKTSAKRKSGFDDVVEATLFALTGPPMVSVCQEGKSSPDALRRSAGYKFFRFAGACAGLSAVVPIQDRTRLPFAVSALEGPHRRLS